MKSLRAELNQKLQGGKVERIAMSDRHTIVLTFYAHGQKHDLLLSSNPSLLNLRFSHRIKVKSLNPPPAFLMTLRKYLLGSKLLEVTAPPYERLFDFSFESINNLGDLTKKHLIVEFMNRVGNTILVNQSGIIHTAIKHIDHSVNRYRETLPAHPYILPPPQNKIPAEKVLEMSSEDIFQRQKANSSLTAAIYRNVAGFSPSLGRETAYRAGLDWERSWQSLNTEEKDKLYRALKEICQEISQEEPYPAIYYSDGDDNSKRRIIDVHTVRLSHLPHCEKFSSSLEAVSKYYQEIHRDRRFSEKEQSIKSKLNDLIKKTEKKRILHQEALAEGKKAEQYKLYGELLLSNIYAIKNPGKSVRLKNYYDNNKEIEIDLDQRYSVADNANRYFAEYAKNKRRYKQAKKLLQKDNAELKYLDSIMVNLNCAEDYDDLLAIEDEIRVEKRPNKNKRKSSPEVQQEPGRPAGKKRRALRHQRKKSSHKNNSERPLPPRRFISSDGLNIQVGRNNKQNDRLTLRKARKDDLWFHIKDAAGAHVIIMAEGQDVPEKSMLEAAGLAAWYSSGNRAGGAKTSVDYCQIRHVWKPNGAKPGHVLYDNYQTVTVYPLDPAKLKKAN